MNDYDILAEIGRGSFATVFKAIHKSTQNVLAVKTVNKGKLNRKLAENLETEITILRKTQHKNIVALFNVIQTEREIHLIMEFCTFGDLSLFIKKKGKVGPNSESINHSGLWGGLDEFVIRYFLGQLSCAVEFLRKQKIIHRDLKPQVHYTNKNILLAAPNFDLGSSNQSLVDEKLSKLPILKLGDFGFARALDYQSLASTLCGSPLYMAPEILKGDKYGPKSDLWSVGTIIYEMTTGKPPFRAQNHIELLRKIERGSGYIRFPDESYDETQLQSREYHGSLQRQVLHRKSINNSIPIQNGMHVGSLGSSPGAIHRNGKSPPIPADLKQLILGLLKRNPMERMAFEEFFINDTIVECRKLDSRLEHSQTELTVNQPESPEFMKPATPKKSNTMVLPTVPDNLTDEIDAPFPEYASDPNWVSKILTQVKIPTVSVGENFESGGSGLSFDSSLASTEFPLSDGTSTPNNIPVSKFSENEKSVPDQDDDFDEDFVVIEKGGAEVTWHQPPSTSPKKEKLPENSRPIPFRGNSFSSSSSSFERALLQTPKGRLFGSLRNESMLPGLHASTSNVELPVSELFGPLPYSLATDTVNESEKKELLELNLSAARAYSVVELAQEFLKQFKEKSDSPMHNNPIILEELVQLHLFALGMFQYSIEKARILWEKCNPAEYKGAIENLKVIFEFLQKEFNNCLETAEMLSSKLSDGSSNVARTPQKLIFETALATAKIGAVNEIRGDPYSNMYRTAILLIQALLQPPIEENDKLDVFDTKILNGLLSQLSYRLVSSR